ncbi:MAG: FkbM family methyltransferase [Hyphomicrobiales bacterium]|nr:FkbM family methyltransferase [Hyphomicrobiales bacterium]
MTARVALPKGTAKSLHRSLRVYHGDKGRHPAMDAMYARFVRPGQLAFDVGSHVGDRISSFRRLGARVVALEPQPGCARAIRIIHGRDPLVTLVQAACGKQAGEVVLKINSANPTVSTASEDFVKAAAGAGGWESQIWDQSITVPCVTLDGLIASHGVPAFIKVDVEGFELAVLEGLSTPVAALSFEFTTIQRDVAYACVECLQDLGDYRFNIALGESQTFEFDKPISADEMILHIQALPYEANSGDVYAVLGR